MTNQFSEIYQLVDQYYDITTELIRKEWSPKVYEKYYYYYYYYYLIFFQANCLISIGGVRKLLPYVPRFTENGVSQFMNVYESLIFGIARTTS